MKFLQRLFSQPKVDTTDHTIINQHHPNQPQEQAGYENLASPEINTTSGLARLGPGMHIGTLSDMGRERERNEDALYAFEALVRHDLGQDSFGLFIVADGMGGHQKGEVASSLAVRVSAKTILEDVYLPYLVNDQTANSRPLNEVLASAVKKANIMVQATVPGGGTTLTLALVMGNTAYIGHIGDTRAYVFKQGELKQITQDHSLAQRLAETGEATTAELEQVQNILYKAIGQTELKEQDVDTHVQHLPSGATLMLCSDGLWGLVKKDAIREILSSAATPQQACEQLINMANANGGRDNITAVIVSMGIEN